MKVRDYKALYGAKASGNRKPITLDAFLAQTMRFHRVGNRYVYEPGWAHLYVRATLRHIEDALRGPVIDLANIEASRPGRGAFTRLVAKIRRKYPEAWVYVECVHNPRFEKRLVDMGFRYDRRYTANLYLKPVQ